MQHWFPLLAAILVSLACSYRRVALRTWSALTAVAIVAAGVVAESHWLATSLTLLAFALVALPLNLADFRRKRLSAPLLAIYQKITPQLSPTEKIALEAGTVGFEGELFSGKPNWNQLLRQPEPVLSADERAFLDGPVEELCRMINDWEITHELADLPPPVWEFLKKNKFFGMIIPREYGGLQFSALAHSVVLQKLASISTTVGSTVAVPNSLGPAELLLHYGTKEQKDYYLPRLADGREIPCFALTGPYAGSDATSIPDYGVVCKGEWNGANVLGVRLTFDKRYITLAPIATVVGLAFRMYDPEQLLGETEDLGITLALLPRDTKGLEIGRRHMPLNIPFQNGPVRGKDVFVPLSQLIGGPEMAGEGWRMLVECLSVGRAISLPSNATGAARIGSIATGAYARIRKQFGMAIGRFEGVEEALARIGGYTYAISALSRATAAAVDRGEKPSVPSAIAKYHATELGREIAKDVMDVHGGKGVILGPRNYAGRAWQGAPIAITVEGANILTRSMMIFGQGAIRCHPFVLKEMQATQLPDYGERLKAFDKALFGHIGFAISNAVRSFVLGLTHAKIGSAPGDKYTRRFYRKLNRYAAALALTADTSMLVLGGKLKFKEKISARLGDVLSNLYIASAMLKRYEDQGRPVADQPMLAWAFHDCVWRMQMALDGVLRNFPVRPVAWLLRALIFPLGRREVPPSDRLGRRVAAILCTPNETRDRLAGDVYLTPHANNPIGRMNALLADVIAAEPVERKFLKAVKTLAVKAYDYNGQLAEVEAAGAITSEERKLLERVRAATFEFISVDDFDPRDLEAAVKHGKTVLRSVA
ncbi:MAG: acyl-CoA dehydrogenase [Lysobacterales bacterium 69-70]|nr:acyl-CoA dehydrogenase [Xanthomonadaceae bacterium]ODU34231.1 MAG: acyl-CoA dehydrogenase [Xanthomonadaceae bacterium SCN 69-320]ODV18510.1 MAG: acyl-CoA dehydrogenase [Xanthomonadaceae bacterium SCN 69-25]OJY96139.1 MAG: acyl-CoA dehydrogenase [Xanthomonadales bacterium 69-70]